MAYIFSSEELQGTVTASSATAPMPTHANNDIIFVFAGKDSSPAMTETSASGWTALTACTDSSSYWGNVWWKRATGSSETAATFTFTTETYHIVTVVVRGAHTSQAPAENNSSNDASIPWTQNTAITTTWANSLVLHGIFTDGGVGPTAEPGVQNFYYGDAGANSTGVAWKFYPTSSSAVDVNFYGRLNDAAKIKTIEIRDDGSNTVVQGYVAQSALTWIAQFTNSTGDGFFTSLPTSLSLASVGGVTTTYDALTNATDRGINPYLSTYYITPPTNATNLAGAEAQFSAQDWDTGYLLSSYMFNIPRDWIDQGLYATKGVTLTLLDTGNDYRSWIIGAKDSPTTPPDKRILFAIQPAQSTDTTWASTGTFNADAIDTIMPLANSPFGSTALFFSYLMLSGEAILAGGKSADTLGFDEFVDAFNNGSALYPILERVGSAATVWNPIKVGGVDPVHVSINLRTFQFPRAFDNTDKILTFHVDADSVGIRFDARSGDTCNFTNCVFTSDSRYYWEVPATASSGATWDFSGTTVAGALVTLRDVTTFDSMAFVNSTIDSSNCDITNSSLTSPPNSNNSLTTNASTTIVGCNVGVLSLSAGNYLCSVASPVIFTNNDFTGSASAGHAIRITTAGTYSFVGNTFTGFGADGTTSAAIYNDSGGAVTLNLSGGGTVPTVRNGASATTTINNAVTVQVTAKDADDASNIENARLRLESAGTTGDLTPTLSCTITRSGSTATVTQTAHGMSNSDKVIIRGSDQDEYNGTWTISNVSTNAYDYTVSGTPTTPATGTITGAAVILEGLTNASGIIQDTAFNFTSNQAITGSIRKGSATPFYKASVVSGTITSSGFDTTAFMIGDE